MTCPHKRIRSLVLVLEPNHEQDMRRAVISLQCVECKQPFEFVGVEGPGVMLSEDRREVRLAVTEAREGRAQ